MSDESSETNQTTVDSYSARGSQVYDDPKNLQFLYGEITRKFLSTIQLSDRDGVVLDVGCGSGFVADVLAPELNSLGSEYIGIDPAQGMLELARKKYSGKSNFRFENGSFEKIDLPDHSVDRIVSTLALHWVKDLVPAAVEMKRVLKTSGRFDIFMIARDDGANFKKAIVAAQRKHLTFAQIMKTALLVQRVNEDILRSRIAALTEDFEINIETHNQVVYGTFDEHMKWWTARSTPVIAEVKDKPAFMVDLREELEKLNTEQGIPFDTQYLWIYGVSKHNG